VGARYPDVLGDTMVAVHHFVQGQQEPAGMLSLFVLCTMGIDAVLATAVCMGSASWFAISGAANRRIIARSVGTW
jgi:hypothetical protein